jgi:hypothetical protein
MKDANEIDQKEQRLPWLNGGPSSPSGGLY